jgi:hypothetical protein
VRPRVFGTRFSRWRPGGGVVVSPGADASACTAGGGQVVCWGEGYSPPDELGRPVPITFESPRGLAEFAVTGDEDPAAWEGSCLIHQGCHTSASQLPHCTARALDWAQVWARPEAFVGKMVDLRGPLGVGSFTTTLKECGRGRPRACCNGTGGTVVLGGAPQLLNLEGLHCGGDESRQCCDAPAYGQTVVARGRLERVGSGWKLDKPRLCVE